ncbi:MAG TPA: DUF1345 domain-containing protein [Stellaceae bacterium]|nr:DUF1345 domain-containing protein [Stellaceae bacterium]
MRLPIAVPRDLVAASGRLLFCAAVGAVVVGSLPDTLRLSIRLASGWVVGAALFLTITAFIIVGSSPERVRRRARLVDPRRWMILAIIVAAAAVSLVALGFTLQREAHETAAALAARLALAGLTVVASWTVTHTVFALHYAHHYYGDGPAPGADDDRGGLAFPGDELPDYWDFLYFSFVVGMTCQVSDVQVTSRPMRRMTLIHGVLSFFFNTVILALSVNLLASSL